MVASVKDLKWGITGGSGQLAKSLVNLLNQREIPHTAWSRADLDTSDLTAINKIKESKISVLINCAAWTDVDGAEDETKKALLVNKLGAENVALAARELEIPLIHISTDYVFSGNGQRPWKVNDDRVPNTQYGMTKLMGEEAIKDIGGEDAFNQEYGLRFINSSKSLLSEAIIDELLRNKKNYIDELIEENEEFLLFFHMGHVAKFSTRRRDCDI